MLARQTIREALHLYTAGDLPGALDLLDRLPGAAPISGIDAWDQAHLERTLTSEGVDDRLSLGDGPPEED